MPPDPDDDLAAEHTPTRVRRAGWLERLLGGFASSSARSAEIAPRRAWAARADRPLSHPPQARTGRDGRRLRGRGPEPRPPRRAEDDQPPRRGEPPALPARGPRRGQRQPPPRLPDLRDRRGHRPALHRDGAARRRATLREAEARAAGGGRGLEPGARDALRPRRSARARRRPPRREALQRVPDVPRHEARWTSAWPGPSRRRRAAPSRWRATSRDPA